MSLYFLSMATTPATAEELEDEVVYEIVGGEIRHPDSEENLAYEGLWGNLEAGAGGVSLSRDSFKFGEYSGLEDGDVFGVGALDVSSYKDSYFFNASGDNLGLDNRRLTLDTGKVLDYRFNAEFDQVPHLLTSQNKTPFDGVGSGILTLKPGFVQNLSFAGSPITVSEDVELKLDGRRTYSFGFTKNMDNKALGLQYKRIKKDGLVSLAGVVGNHPANPHSIILPARVDTTTNEFSLSFSGQSEKSQWEFGYFLSSFLNHNSNLTFQTPFAGNVPFFDGTPVGFGPLPTTGRIAMEPDNHLHRISFSGSHNLSSSTRVSAIAEYSLSRQDENLLPYSVGTTTVLLPRQTADAKIHVYHVTLQLNTRPAPGWNFNGKFRHYQTKNETPRTLFLAVVNDTGAQVPVTSDRAIFNLPYDYYQDQVTLDGSYRLAKATQLKMGYELENIHRSFRAVDDTLEHKVTLGLSSRYFSKAMVSARAQYGHRRGDTYNYQDVVNARHTPQFLASAAAPLFAVPSDMTRFDIANRERTQLNLNASFFPTDLWTFGLGYQIQADDFDDAGLGLQRVIGQSITLDTNYSPSDSASYTAFFTYGNTQRNQRNRSHNFTVAGSISDSNRNYEVDLDDQSFTAGAQMHLTFLDNKYSWDFGYTFSGNQSDLTFAAGSDPAVANPTNLPEINSYIHTITTTGKRRLSKYLSAGLTYSYENYRMDNFFTDSVDPLSIGNDGGAEEVIFLRRTIQDYEAHVFMFFVIYNLEGI